MYGTLARSRVGAKVRTHQFQVRQAMARSTGKVKWFSQEKGYGFIQQDSGPDVFVHHSQIQASGFRTLNEGERVEFDVIEEPKGLKAQNVTRLDAPAGNGDGGGYGGGGGGGGRGGRGGGRGERAERGSRDY